MDIQDLFNNREIALGIWLFVFFAWSLTKQRVRKSFVAVIKSFFDHKILGWLFLMASYTTYLVVAFQSMNLWDEALLKDTILWFFAGAVLAFHFTTSKEDDKVLSKIVKDSVKVVILFEFLINTYTFPLLGELAFVPFVAVVVMVDAYARLHEEYAVVLKFTSTLLAIIGLSILAFAVYSAVADYKALGNLDTLRSILLPPVLSIALAPFIYFMLLVFGYETIFTRLSFGSDKSELLVGYAKRRIVWYVGFSLKKQRAFLRSNALALLRVRSEADVDELFEV